MSLNQGEGEEGIHPALAEVDRQLLKIASDIAHCSKIDSDIGQGIHGMLTSAVGRTQVSGSLWQQFTAKDYSQVMVPNAFIDESVSAEKGKKSATNDKNRLYDNYNQRKLLKILSHQLAKLTGDEAVHLLQQAMHYVGRRAILLSRLRRVIRFQLLLKLWLQLHVPLSFALLATLIAHVASVFLYW